MSIEFEKEPTWEEEFDKKYSFWIDGETGLKPSVKQFIADKTAKASSLAACIATQKEDERWSDLTPPSKRKHMTGDLRMD